MRLMTSAARLRPGDVVTGPYPQTFEVQAVRPSPAHPGFTDILTAGGYQLCRPSWSGFKVERREQ